MTAEQHGDLEAQEAHARARARLAVDLLQSAIMITHADAGHVQWCETGGPRVRTIAQLGLPRAFGPVADGDPGDRALWRRVVDSRRRIVVHDLFAARPCSTAEEALIAVGLHATQASPIISSAGDLVGVLSTHTRLARVFSDDELGRLDALLHRMADFLGEASAPAVFGPFGSRSEDWQTLDDDLASRHTQLDLRVAVGQAVDETTAQIREYGHELTVCLGADPVWLTGDRRRLIQVFSSLLGNAVTHTPASGKLSVFVHSSTGWASVHVSDNGYGIPRDMLDRILVRRAACPDDPPLTRSELNLAEVRRLIEQHDGEFVAHSDGPGLGSRFVVRLPTLSAYRSLRRV